MKEQIKKRLGVLSVTSLMVGATALGIVQSDPAQAALYDGFLKIDGIPGESADDKHKNEIDIVSYSETFDTKECSVIKITKRLDSASPRLASLATTGSIVPNMTLTLRKAGKDQQSFYKMILRDVAVLGSEFSLSQGAPSPLETISLKAKTAVIEYLPIRADGSLGNKIQQVIVCSPGKTGR